MFGRKCPGSCVAASWHPVSLCGLMFRLSPPAEVGAPRGRGGRVPHEPAAAKRCVPQGVGSSQGSGVSAARAAAS